MTDIEKDGCFVDWKLHDPRFELISNWAHKRNLVEGSDPHRQLTKLLEEVGELASVVAKGNREKVVDSIGDAVVVLTILAEQHDVNIEDCIDAAWNEIKDRKGKMVNGIFVKESDLNG